MALNEPFSAANHKKTTTLLTSCLKLLSFFQVKQPPLLVFFGGKLLDIKGSSSFVSFKQFFDEGNAPSAPRARAVASTDLGRKFWIFKPDELLYLSLAYMKANAKIVIRLEHFSILMELGF